MAATHVGRPVELGIRGSSTARVKAQAAARHYAWPGAILLAISACSASRMPTNRFLVADYGADGASREMFEDFPQGYYRSGEDGLVDIVLYRPALAVGAIEDDIVQTIHIQTYWRARPGTTHLQDSMLNSLVTYCLMRGDSGITYDGGGFVRYRIPKEGDVLNGVLARANLQPLRRTGDDLQIFHRAALSGRFQAQCDPRRVARLIEEIDRSLGARPALEPQVTSPAL
jgi:hypothetical protein